MTVREALEEGAVALRPGTGAAGDGGTPFLDASVLLAAALGVSRSALLSRYPDALPPEAIEPYRSLVRLRKAGTSVAYLTGRKEFYGRDFLVDARVLVPRPDTEILVETALRAMAGRSRGLRVHDVCTGSGCVAITLALERTDAVVSASDISRDALRLAVENAAMLSAGPIDFSCRDLLCGLEGPFDVIVGNPPYVGSEIARALLAEGGGEPALALDGGENGLDFYPALARGAYPLLAPGGALALEIGDDQGRAVSAVLAAAGFRGLETVRDLGGRDRVVKGTRP